MTFLISFDNAIFGKIHGDNMAMISMLTLMFVIVIIKQVIGYFLQNPISNMEWYLADMYKN